MKASKSYLPWSEDEINILKTYYPISIKICWQELNKIPGFNRTKYAMKAQATRSNVLVRERIKTSRFQKGHTPYNKGKKMPEDYSTENMKKTQFQKGMDNHNKTFVGNLRLRERKNRFKPDGSKYRYWWIKIANPKKWELLHRNIWKKEHGAIPKGMIIIFKDNDSDNCVLDNLEMISMAENAKRNHNRKKAIQTRLKNINSDETIAKRLEKEFGISYDDAILDKELIEIKRLEIKISKKLKSNKNG